MPDRLTLQRSEPAAPAEPPGASPPRSGRLIRRALFRILSDCPVLVLTAVYFAVACCFIPEMASRDNLGNVALNMLPLLAVAIGQTIVLITGGIDLSVTSIIALTSVAGAWLMNDATGHLAQSPAAVPMAISIMILIGAAIGLLNGAAVTLLGMPPFIVTLTVMMSVSGLAVWSTQSKSIGHLPADFTGIGFNAMWGVPYAALLVVGLAILAHLFLSRTMMGQWIYAIGHNPRVCVVSGVPVRLVTTIAYVLSGLCAAIASVIYTARLETGSPTLGREILLDVVGAAVIGGTSLFGGRGKIIWTVLGVALFSLVANTLNLLGLQHYTIMMMKGGVILLAAALDLVGVKAGEGS